MAADLHTLRLSRRQFVRGAGAAGLAVLGGCGRPPPQAQPPKVPTVGYLGAGDASSPSFEAFREGLREYGYVEGQNVEVEARFAGGRHERFPALAAELVRLQPAVIVSGNTPETQALQQATSSIPIVFSALSDPVGVGLVAGLDRPGGNLTGTSDLAVGVSAKRLSLLKETVPGASRVAALWNPSNAVNALDLNTIQDAARTLGLEIRPVEARSADDLPSAFETIAGERAQALIMLADPVLTVVNTPQLADLVAKSRLPSMHFSRTNVEAGMLMSYGPNREPLRRRAAYYVDRILKGAKPADLPVEQPREFEFVINLRTAQSLGITIPSRVLIEATEVLE